MFFEASDYSSEPVALARMVPQDHKLMKLPTTNVPKLPLISPSYQFLPASISPRQKHIRLEGLYMLPEKSPFGMDENVGSRGPKVLTKNFPDVFASNASSAYRLGKVASLKSRNKVIDGDQSSLIISKDLQVHTEPSEGSRFYDSSAHYTSAKYGVRFRDRSPKPLYDKRGHLNYLLGGPSDLSGRISNDGSTISDTKDSLNEHFQSPLVKRLKSNEDTLQSERDYGTKLDILPNIIDNMSLGNSSSKPDNSPKMMNDSLKFGFPAPGQSSLGKAIAHSNFEASKRQMGYKRNMLAEIKEASHSSFHEFFKAQIQDIASIKGNGRENLVNASVSPRNLEYGNSFFSMIDKSTLETKVANKQESQNKKPKKLVVLKKVQSKSIYKDKIPTIFNEKDVKFLPISIPNLNELLTLKTLKTISGKGRIKRMLHVPTFKIFDLHEESISELNSKDAIYTKERLDEWKNISAGNRNLSRIFSCFWNSPESCVSILLEPSRSGNLSELLFNYQTIPENCIQTLSKDLLSAIDEVHEKLQYAHGNILSTEVNIDSQGHFKLGPGIKQIFNRLYQNNEEESLSMIQQSSPKFAQSQKETRSQDIFDFGFLLLECALGDLSFYDPLAILKLETIKKALEAPNLKKKTLNSCCLLHSEDLVRQLLKNLNNSSTSRTTNRVGTFSNKALKSGKRFTENFIDFLCNCLKLDEGQRLSSTKLLDHQFLSDTHICNGPLVSMKEVLKIKRKEMEISKNVGKTSAENLGKFREALGIVFLNRDTQEKFENMMKKEAVQSRKDDKKIIDLAIELDVSPKRLWDEIKICLDKLKTDKAIG